MKPHLSIVVPAFDEEERIGGSIAKILVYLQQHSINAEVVIVDDGSKDRTADVAKVECAKFPQISTAIIRYEQNRGKGFAVRTGLAASLGNIAVFSDADLSTPIEEMPKLVEPIANGEVDVAFGSRALDRSLIGNRQPWRREQGGRVINLVIRLLSGLPFADTQCGFKAFNMTKFRPLLDVMTIDRFGFDVEMLYVSNLYKLQLREIPVRWNNVEGSKVSVVRDTRRMFTELIEIRRNARNGVYDLK